MSFSEYATPVATLKYSSQYFASLTFARTEELDYPTIATSSIIERWCFSSDISFTAAGTVIQPGEKIPPIKDLYPIMRDMEKAFADGARSVSVVLNVDGQRQNFLFQFSKIRLFVAINNNYLAVLGACNVLEHIIAHNLLSSTALDQFRGLRIFAPIVGFEITDFPLWKLACLLGETWLEEDVVNALLELAYLRETMDSMTDPSHILLPTSFSNDISYLFQNDPKFYSANLHLICSRLRTIPSPTISFVVWRGNHFSGYHYKASLPVDLHHGDSMGRPAQDDILPSFQWLLEHTGHQAPRRILENGITARQGPQSGSCGIAAVDYVTLGCAATAPWTDEASPAFRNKSLQDLIIYHLTCVVHDSPVTDWLIPCLVSPASAAQLDIADDGPVGFNDFNLHRPARYHPIHLFSKNVMTEPPVALAALPKLPLQRIPPLPKLAGLAVDPAVIVLDSDSDDDSDDSIIDLTRSSPAIKQETIDLTRTSPPLLTAGTIILQDPDEDLDDIVVSGPRPLGSASSIQPKPEPLSDISNSQRPPLEIIGDINIGKTYNSFEEGQADIYALEARRGHIWRIAQTKKVNDAAKRITLRCNHYYRHAPTHLQTIDPSDHRRGKSIKTDCMAHVNLSRSAADGTWHVSLTDWKHNHPPQVPSGGSIPRPPTQAQRDLVNKFANSTSSNFSRSQVGKILQETFPDHLLEPGQISNLLNTARSEARRDIERLGGDAASVLDSLTKKADTEHGWRYSVRLNNDQVLIGIFWQSPVQVDLAKRFYDILLNDDTYNRNQYGYPLDIGIVIDNFGKSRNAWYALHEKEDTETHVWVLQEHLKAAGREPVVFGSDKHGSLIAAASRVIPTSLHIYCLNHLNTNVAHNLRPKLGSEWTAFQKDFWTTYRAVSPDEFERLWKHLTSTYPAAQQYLDAELYTCRQRWAWAWIGSTFTAGVRTSGRVEAENGVNKTIGGPKKSLLQLFKGLNDRTNGQTQNDLIRQRQSSRRHHVSNLESLFLSIIEILRKYAGPFANEKCRREMEESMFYSVEVVQLPSGSRDWATYSFQVEQEVGFSSQESDTHMINPFEDDKAYISAKWLINLIRQRGLQVKHLIRVLHRATGAAHYVVLLKDGRYLCDCCMDANLGLVCRHFFVLWITIQDLPFHLSLIRARWYQDPAIDLQTLPAVTKQHTIQPESVRLDLRPIPPPDFGLTLPRTLAKDLTFTSQDSGNPTETLPAREVFHEIQAAIRPLVTHAQTREQVDDLLQSLDRIRYGVGAH
ncbi:hypothetical protein MSAN_01153300 [Mycena sanguinolenta]|uniref:SWIM-type domain-containing protein n=1 Tax=Mycena sanguinolenta TaxID=230812 RepID=A0A8H7D6J1_9AGAR|nr:hypothetical protein MSAN_01153300 [Mycena sanguinolenta]